MAYSKEQVQDWIAKGDTVVVGKLVFALYQRQTSTEQVAGSTQMLNGQGFNGCDAPWLTKMAKAFEKYHNLTPKQADSCRKRLKKYAGQLANIASSLPAAA